MTSKRKKIFKIGDEVPLNDARGMILKDLGELQKDSQTAFRLASTMHRKNLEKFWKMLRELYPELKEFDVSYQPGDDKIQIISERGKSCGD